MQAFQNLPNNDIKFPAFTFTDSTADADFDFNILSEYLFEEDKYPLLNTSDGLSGTADEPFGSDNDDCSSVDENGTKRRKGADGKFHKSQDQIDRRRERNRVLARKTRLRKKYFFESLQKQVSQLATENEMLKEVIRDRVNNDAIKSKILSECTAELPPIIATSSQNPTSVLEKKDFKLISTIQAAQRSFVITDPSLPDNPIIFASQGFLELCGYSLEEVLGRNCRFLQGPDTDAKQVEIMRDGIAKGEDTSVCILNYRADGTPFYNQIFVAALRDSNMNIINYVGVQCEIKRMDLESAATSTAPTPKNKSRTNTPKNKSNTTTPKNKNKNTSH